MTRTTGSARLVRRSAALAGLLALCASGTALADITGKVTNAGGVPVPGASVRAVEADGSSAGFASTDANGDYSIATAGDVPPFTVTASITDSCRPFGQSNLEQAAAGLPDGAVQNFVLDAFAFCGSTFISSSLPQPTGHAWPERAQVLSAAGGVTYLRVLAPSNASDFSLSLADGRVVGTGTSRTQVQLTAPADPYNGPLNLNYVSGGVPSTRQIATLVSGAVLNPNPPSGSSDLAAIVDISGSMGGADPGFRRKDAVQLLVDLSNSGDRLVGTAFDDEASVIFPRTTITTQTSKNRLKALARKRIVNSGGTDYDQGIGAGFAALSADPLNPGRPKTAIFLTDGAHNGTYQNSHLRFAFNGTGRSWPICVVQLGRSFQASDRERLRRIARETGGIYRATPTNVQLSNLYFQCLGRSAGAQTLLKRTNVFRVGQTRTFSRKIKKGQRRATFFVSWGVGRYRLQAIQPGGKVYRKSVGKRVRLVRGKAFAAFQVQNPKAGRWRLRVTRLATGGRTDKATTTVTVQRRR